MTKIYFSKRNNGACPLCRKYDQCHILFKLRETINLETKEKYDDEMELVIYRCPEFEQE